MTFVIFHGSFGHPEENWIPTLKNNLETLNQEVFVPRFPAENWDEVSAFGPSFSPQNQTLSNWFKKFEEILPLLRNAGPPVFIGHSLAPVFILHLLEKYDLLIDSAIFVCPFLEKLNKDWQIDLANSTFYRTDFDFNALKKQIGQTYVLYSDNDPYVDAHFSLDFALRLGSSPILVKGAGHMNSEAGITDLPLLLELCKTRFIYKKTI